jgi:hypothetical protein
MRTARRCSLAATALSALMAVLFVSSCATRPDRHSDDDSAGKAVSEAARRYTYGYWLHGWRKHVDDASPDVLCLEAGNYGLAVDVDTLANTRFGMLGAAAAVDYAGAATSGSARMASLPPADLAIELDVAGTTYRAVGGRPKGTRLWESGRIAQHFDLVDLQFADANGNRLPCYGNLDITAWPGSLTFTTELMPDLVYADGPTRGVVGNGWCMVDEPLDVPHRPELEPETLSVECWVNIPPKLDPRVYGWLVCKNDNEWGIGNYGFMYRRGKVSAVLNNAGGRLKQQAVDQRGSLEPDQWHHLAMTWDGATLTFYVNGGKHGSRAVATPRTRGTGHLRIGKRADDKFGTVSGLYDQVRVWSRALTAAEVKAHATNPGTVPNRAGLVLARDFDEGAAVEPPVWHDATLRASFATSEQRWQQEQRVAGPWQAGDKKVLSLPCNFDRLHDRDRKLSVTVATPDGQRFPVTFDPVTNCQTALVKELKRSFRGGYVKITDYDEFDIVIDCADEAPAPVPFLLDLRGPANITGRVPMLCRPDGTPTGVHVQLSKNWHYRPMGAYLRAYALIPVERGRNHYRLRIAYGFYGALPSASHGQLCLVGYGGNQRWDQQALASGGESITFDADMSLTDVAVCDVRLPLGRKGADGNTWGWTDAGWGGDWLGIYDGDRKMTFAAMKTAYLAHGPCLPDVLYHGYYGSDRRVRVAARVQLPRTDDYGRTFQQLQYRFEKQVAAANSYLLRRHARAFDTVVAYGNGDGLLAEVRVTPGHKEGDLLIPPTALTGPAPWWVAFPGRSDDGPPGYVSLVIRGFDATFGGKAHERPYLMARVQKRRGDEASLETWIVPPPEVDTYRRGDTVTLDTEWLHLAPTADNYGGPNDAYRQHLRDNPRSWKTTWREVRGNDLEVTADGGAVVQTLPIVVRVAAPEVTVSVRGGVGYVPIRFEGLAAVDGYGLYEVVGGVQQRLDQSVHGNDYWQTDYDAGSDSYRLTFNLPLDGKAASTWVLRAAR